MRFIDTHCHVHFQAYKQDMDEVIERSLNEGVFMITVGTQSTTSKNGLALAERYEGVWTTIGLHPNHTCEQKFFDEEELGSEEKSDALIKTRCEEFDASYYRELAAHPKVVAIGECGLDFYRIPEEANVSDARAKQVREVRKQFDLADELNLPLVIHCRDAHREQQEILREYVEAGKLQRRGVVHCFTGTREQAQVYFDLGFLVSFTGIITFPPRKGDGELSPLQRVVSDVPLDRLMIETDAPYLTPVPHRGERNEPRYVKHVAEKIAELKGLTLEEVAEATFQNAVKLFGLKIG
jgi:TatD DNase family protein